MMISSGGGGEVGKMLILPIKKRWFDMIRSGEKTEEYREIKPYWATRFTNAKLLSYNGQPSGWVAPVTFKNGYAKDAPTIRVLCGSSHVTKNIYTL